MLEKEILYVPVSNNSWYNDLKYYLNHGSGLGHLDACKIQYLRLKYAQYQLINGILFQRNYDNVLLIWFEKVNADKVLSKLHDGPVGGHFGGETTTHKVLSVGYYWPKLFKYAHSYAIEFQVC